MFSRTFVFGDQVWPIIGPPVFALSSYDVAAFAFSPAWLRHAKPKGLFGDQVWPIVGQPVFALELRRARFAFSPAWLRHAKPKGRSVVEPDGIEPTTSCLQSTSSPS